MQSIGAEHRPSPPREKHVPAQLQPAPGVQLAPLRQSSGAPQLGPDEHESVEQTQAPDVAHVLSGPPHDAVPLKTLQTP